MDKLLRRFLPVAAFACACSAADAQSWQPLSPDGGTINKIVAEPGATGRAFAVDEWGLFVSDDAGRTWRETGRGLIGAPFVLAIAPDAARAYAFDGGSGRLMRSDDHGANWTPTGYTYPQGDSSWALALTNDAVLSAPYSGNGVYRSTDGGATFAPTQGIPADQRIGVIVPRPLAPQDVIAGVALGPMPGAATLYRSTDGGANWTPLFAPPLSGSVESIVFGSGDTIVAAIGSRIYVSADDGATWSQRAQLDSVRVVRPDPNSAELIATNGQQCYRTFDAFVSTVPCAGGLPSRPTGENGFSSLAVVRDGANGYRVLANLRDTGVIALTSGAATWIASNRSLRAESARGIALAPNDAGRLLYGRFRSDAYAGGSLFDTYDGGATWTWSLGRQAQFIRTIAIDPTTAANAATMQAYAAGRSVWLPNGGTTSGIYKSTDGGRTWNPLNEGLPTFSGPTTSGVLFSTVRKVVLDPRSCASPPPTGACIIGPLNTVYVISSGSGANQDYRVIKSTQGGANWTAVGRGLPAPLFVNGWYQGVVPVDLEIERTTGAVYVAVFGDYDSADGSPQVATIESGVFRSADGGATWTHAANGLPLLDGSATTTRDVFALVTHPRRAGTLWAATIRLGEGSRIYKTVDAGANWSATSATLAACDVRDLQIDDAAPDVIYAAGVALDGNGGCLWRSENGGADWTALHANLPASVVLDVRQDPQDRRRLVVTTERGVWQTSAPSDKLFVDAFDDR